MWYRIFYFLSVAENINILLMWLIGISMVAFIIFTIIFFANVNGKSDEDSEEAVSKTFRYWWKRSAWICLFAWIFFVLLPSKQDCLMIIAGGSVGEFIQSDTIVQKIPSDITKFLHMSLQKEIKELDAETRKELGIEIKEKSFKEKAADLTKEQLIELIENAGSSSN